MCVCVGPPVFPLLSTVDDLLGSAFTVNEPVAVLVADRENPDIIAWGGLAAQGVALRQARAGVDVIAGAIPTRARHLGHGDLPGLDVEALPSARVILIGTQKSLAPILSQTLAEAIQGPFMGVRALTTQDGADRYVLILSGRTAEHVTTAVTLFSQPDRTFPARAQAVVNADTGAGETSITPSAATPVVGPMAQVTLADLGFQDFSVAGLRGIQTMTLTLPRGFMPTGDAPVELLLDMAYAADMGPEAVLTIFVNGNVAGGVMLPSASEVSILKNHRITLPGTAFRPGSNTITFAATLPVNEREAACPAPGGEPRFTLFGSSRLKLPRFAQVTMLPNLRLMATSGYPYGASDAAVDLVVPAIDDDTLSAAWTLAGRLARARGAPLPLIGRRTVDGFSRRDMIVVGASADLPDKAVKAAPAVLAVTRQTWAVRPPIDPDAGSVRDIAAARATREALARIEQLRTREDGPASRPPVALPGAPGSTGEIAAEPGDGRDYWLRRQQHESYEDEGSGLFDVGKGGLLDRIMDFLDRTTRASFGASSTPLNDADVLAVMAQFESPQAPAATWTLLTAPSARGLPERGALSCVARMVGHP